MNDYGKHTDFTGFKIQSGEEGEVWYDVVKADAGDDCDLCLKPAVYIVEDAVPEVMTCAMGMCQECAVESCNSIESPDVWYHPHHWTNQLGAVYASGTHKQALPARMRRTR